MSLRKDFKHPQVLPYKIYFYKIFPKIKHIRGATRLLTNLEKLARLGLKKHERGKAESIFEKEDWENLFIIDACRYDLYEEVEGISSTRITLGSNSKEFIEKTFSDGDFSNIVYVTANPHFYEEKFKSITGRDIEDTFHSVFHTYKTDWDKENGTVMPGPLIRDAKTARNLFPDKKIIVHFMQPHHPFVNSEFEGVETQGIDQYLDLNPDDPRLAYGPWSLAESGVLKRNQVWGAYKKNLEFILPKVKQAAEELDGKTFLTSDHGNMVGENNLYHHPYGARAEGLVKVPWVKLSD